MAVRQAIAAALIVSLCVLVGIGLWQTSGGAGPAYVTVVREPDGVMGTSCRLVAVVPRGQELAADEALRAAVTELAQVEALMSSWIERSEISRLNAAAADESVALSPRTIEVVRAARRAADHTEGAFDVTCRPVIELWVEATLSDRLPDDGSIAEARAASRWSHFELDAKGVTKLTATARVDLGGIAKGYAIDRAVEAMQTAELAGGMVDVGGDVRCFGRPPSGSRWKFQVRDPFGEGVLETFELDAGAVCTSGNYARFMTIEGRIYSHIIDPRTSRPADVAASVTVVATDALTADVWATALSVLGGPGLARLPEGTDALLIVATGSGPGTRLATGRFRARRPVEDEERVLENRR